MTDTELNQLRQNLTQQFHQMMRDDLPVDSANESNESQWQRSANR